NVSESMLSSLPPFELADDAQEHSPAAQFINEDTRPNHRPSGLGSVFRCIRCPLDGWKCTVDHGWRRVLHSLWKSVLSVESPLQLAGRQRECRRWCCPNSECASCGASQKGLLVRTEARFKPRSAAWEMRQGGRWCAPHACQARTPRRAPMAEDRRGYLWFDGAHVVAENMRLMCVVAGRVVPLPVVIL